MSPRVRVYGAVAACAVGAAAAVVGVTAATHETPPRPPGPRCPRPPFASDRTAPPSRTREVRSALATWPHGTIARLHGLAEAHPRSGIVRLNLGVALFCVRNDAGATAEWRAAARLDPDSQSAIRAQDLLHPDTPPGLPFFVPSGALAPFAGAIALQREGRPVSAERAFASVARARPNDVEAQVAWAVSRFTKDHPERAFSRLGPLAAAHPRDQSVRFHLGLLSIWIRDFPEARRQLGLARASGPGTRLGREARTLLASLVRTGTG